MEIISLSHGVVKRIVYILVFWGCCNKLLQVGGLKQQIYCLTVLKARGEIQVLARAMLPLRALEGDPWLGDASFRSPPPPLRGILPVCLLIFLL